MTETSYPFASDSAGGGGKLVSQAQWQAMAHLWGPDRIDFQLSASSYTPATLPLNVTLSGTNLLVSPGNAWVGGYYYKLDATLTKTAPINNGATPRIDLVVLRTNLTSGAVNVAVVTGQAASSPVEPSPTRTLGGIWEMPLASILLPANNGTRTVNDRRRFDVPSQVSTPWNRGDVSNALPIGSFTLDVDSNATGGQVEGYRGQDGDMVTRFLSRRRTYTPDLFTVSNKPSETNRLGFWRIIAPGTVQFTAWFINTSSSPVSITSGWYMGFSLPIAPSYQAPAIFSGVLKNPGKKSDMPNLVQITAETVFTGTNCALYCPNSTYIAEGLDGLTTIPGNSELIVSGVYETNYFEGRSLSG